MASKEFTLSRTFNAPRELVWKAWTTAELLMQWFGPKGAPCHYGTLDLRPGGTFHYGMKMPDGSTMWGKWTFQEIVKPEKLVTIISFSDKDGGLTHHPYSPTWPLKTLSHIVFTEAGGKTTVHLRWSALDASGEEQATFDNGHAGMQQGWGGTMDALEEFLASQPK